MRERKTALIGTGLIGGQLLEECHFSDVYHSRNIEQLMGKHYDRVICAGLSGDRFLININPNRDIVSINRLKTVLSTVSVKEFILISTIDVLYSTSPYAKNRLAFEVFVKQLFPKVMIVRLPNLISPKMKKGFFRDLSNPYPSYLSTKPFNDDEIMLLSNCYQRDETYLIYNGNEDHRVLSFLKQSRIDPLHFHSRHQQGYFYILEWLAADLAQYIKMWEERNQIEINLISELIAFGEIADVFGIELADKCVDSQPVSLPYIYSKSTILKTIAQKYENFLC